VLQFTPPGSGCSVIFGKKNVTTAAPGSSQGLYLIVSDLEATRAQLVGRGRFEVSKVFHNEGVLRRHGRGLTCLGGVRCQAGRMPNHRRLPLVRLVQRSRRQRLAVPGAGRRRGCPVRIDSAATTFASSSDLANAMRRAAAAHGKHEEHTGGQPR